MNKGGWYKESYRHSLAAKGITTKKYYNQKKTQGVPAKIGSNPLFPTLSMERVTNNVVQATSDVHEGKRVFARDVNTHSVGVGMNFFPEAIGAGANSRVFDTKHERGKALPGNSFRFGSRYANQYFSEKKKGLLDMPHEDTMVESLRQQDINTMQEEVFTKLNNAVDEGELDAGDREKFVKEVFAGETKMYHDGHIDKGDYESTIRRKLNSYLGTYGKKAHIFDELENPHATPHGLPDKPVGFFDWEQHKPKGGGLFAHKQHKQNKRYYSYSPTYGTGDLAPIAADGIGTAGAGVVSWIPTLVPLALLYGGATLAKRRKDRRAKEGKGFFKQKETMFGEQGDERHTHSFKYID